MSEAPYTSLVAAYALAGRVDRARSLMAEWDARRRTSPSITDSSRAHEMRGFIALHSRNYAEAQVELLVRTMDG